MNINITNIGTKEWLDFKADITFGLYYSLRNLGFDTTITVNKTEKSRLNILIGADFIANNERAVLDLIGSGTDFVVYEVEAFDGNTINGRADFNLDNYLNLINAARFVLTPYRYNVDEYSKIFGPEKVCYARWGFYDQLYDPGVCRNSRFVNDALFFGLLKGQRQSSLTLLQKHLDIVIWGKDEPLAYKRYLFETCRWGLHLTYGESEKFTNPFRIYHMVANGVPVISNAPETLNADGYLQLCLSRANIDEVVELIASDTCNEYAGFELLQERRLSDELAVYFSV